MSVANQQGDPLKAIALEGRDWLLNHAAPLWAPRRYDWGPLFPERMSISGVHDSVPHRLFVQARHIFSYIQAGRMGWSGPWREHAADQIDAVLARGRRADGFFIHKFALDGGAHDDRADLYDQAFMLLALAHASAALERPDLMVAAIAARRRARANIGACRTAAISKARSRNARPFARTRTCICSKHLSRSRRRPA